MTGLFGLLRPSLPALIRQAQVALHTRALALRGAPPLVVFGVGSDRTPFEETRDEFEKRVQFAVASNRSNAPALIISFPRATEHGD